MTMQLPDRAFLQTKDNKVVVLTKGKRGYQPFDTDRTAEELNIMHGVTGAQLKAMLLYAMMRFDFLDDDTEGEE